MKNKRAILVELEKLPNGNIKISLDDLLQSYEEKSEWTKDVFITSKEYDKDVLEELSFDEKELADFGYSIISRLYAFYKRDEI